MYLPAPLRRRLTARDARVRAQGVKRGVRQGIKQGAARQRAAREKTPHRYVFVVSYGRTGSTLLQGLLNALPRTLVRGENGLYVLDLYRAQASVSAMREGHLKHDRRTPESAFFGLKEIRPQAFERHMRELVSEAILGRTRSSSWDVIGFKEVAWHRIEPEETAGFFDAMDRAFPDVRYVLNTRDHSAVLASGFWKRVDEDAARRLIERVGEVQEHLRRTRPDRVVEVRYEAMTSSDRAERDELLRTLGDFVLGAPVSEEVLASLRETLARPHGPNPTAQA